MHFESQTESFKALLKEGSAYLKSNPHGRYASGLQWAWSLAFLALMALFYSLVYISETTASYLLYCILLGITIYMVIAAFCHDAAHGSLSKNKHINAAALYLGFALIGVNGPLWRYRHLHLHHPFPNVQGSDVDADSSYLIRLSPNNPWHFLHRYQVYYSPVLYGFVLQYVAWFEDFFHLRNAIRQNPKRHKNLKTYLGFVGSKLIHFSLLLFLPYWFLDVTLAELMLGYFLVTCIGSFMFVLINIGSHITDKCSFPQPNQCGGINVEWARHQIESSVDWMPFNRFVTALTGGANAHAAHHLFPQAAHCHVNCLTEIVSKNAAKADYVHNNLGFFGMIKANWSLLKKLSVKPNTFELANSNKL